MALFDPKRPTDFVLSALGLVALAPVMAAVAVAVAVALGRPVFFRQERPGLHGRPFRLIKFRTMLDAVDSEGNPLDDARRLTRFGRFLRASSLDELPELWNVLRGDMSLVGPRPLLMRYLPLYSPEQARRHDVRPGLTGWSQVNGRNALGWPEKLALDVWYVDNRSFGLDLKILLMTVAKVLSRAGIAAEGSETMPEFLGAADSPGENDVRRSGT
jgi:lipopolysaccharide/colanic/teichoic acid biosynthesis glycosyltransferase